MSIAKAQAAALADGFIASRGSNKGDFEPREAYTAMIILAGELIEDAQNNLIASNSVAKGNLSASLIANEPEQVSGDIAIDIFMLLYGIFVNKGVKGTKSGSSTAGYAFKYDKPSKSMVDAIREYLKNAHVSVQTVKKYAGHGRHENKHKRLSVAHQADAAYAFARSIKQKGIKATGFMDKAISSTQKKVLERVGLGLKIDIINSLK